MKTLASEIQRFWIDLIHAQKAVNSPAKKFWGNIDSE